MRIVLFCHSVLSDWNHRAAHFLRGVTSELVARGHRVRVYEPRDAWSVQNLVRDHGEQALGQTMDTYPALRVERYDRDALDLDEALDGADLVIVHEWNEPELVRAIGSRRKAGGRFRLLYHDTHHRAVADPTAMNRYDLSGFDGILVFGAALQEVYERRGWGGRGSRVWVWHEAADVRIFRPLPSDRAGDVLWIGNWGDDEWSRALDELLLDPVHDLGLSAKIHGVRFPAAARERLAAHGFAYGGFIPNHRVPEAFARYKLTVHVPREPYVSELPGIPTIRVFEALACGIPLVTGRWDDAEGLFTPGDDFLVAKDGAEMKAHLKMLVADEARRDELAQRGLATILRRHTCAHRADELCAIARALGAGAAGTGAQRTFTPGSSEASPLAKRPGSADPKARAIPEKLSA